MRTGSDAVGLGILFVWLALLAGAVELLTATGVGPLGAPSLTDFAAWREWPAGRDAVTVAFALLRLATLAVAWYLVGATVIGIAARLVRHTRLIAAADALAVPAVRGILQAAFGAGLAAATLTAVSSAVPTAPAQPPAVDAAAFPPPPVEMTPADDEEMDIPPAPVAVARPVRAPAKPEKTWTVEPGDHLWSIAELVLERAWERQPSDHETAAYWTRLIDSNRRRLTDPGSPDLIHAGQVFELPPVPPT